MRIDDVLAHEPLVEMSYSRRKAEAVITALEKSINDHLLKLMVVETSDYEHWITELLEWLDEVAEIRLKPNNKPAPAAFYFRVLFDEPFGGAEMDNITRRVRRMLRQGYTLRHDVDLDVIAGHLRSFHAEFAEACSKGINTDQIEKMIRRLIS
jgi:hypothetical protein